MGSHAHGLVAFLTGPTAAGKTAVACELAERLGLEILSVDSRQVYRELELGTAKPTAEERSRVRHHLVDLWSVSERSSAGRFAGEFLRALDDCRARGRGALAVGGTGLYWKALTSELHELPRGSAEIRKRHDDWIAGEGAAALHARLAAVDPEAAARLAPLDRQRVSRALEIFEQTGRPLSDWLRDPPQCAPLPPVPVIVIDREREDLESRIRRRCESMFEAGLVEEVRSLLASGVARDAPGMKTVGYRELLPHVDGAEDGAAALERLRLATRQYAKRQRTWFRHQLPDAVRVELSPEEPPSLAANEILERLSDAGRAP